MNLPYSVVIVNEDQEIQPSMISFPSAEFFWVLWGDNERKPLHHERKYFPTGRHLNAIAAIGMPGLLLNLFCFGGLSGGLVWVVSVLSEGRYCTSSRPEPWTGLHCSE